MKFCPYEKGGGGNVLAMMKGGGWHKKISFSHIVGGVQKVSTL